MVVWTSCTPIIRAAYSAIIVYTPMALLEVYYLPLAISCGRFMPWGANIVLSFLIIYSYKKIGPHLVQLSYLYFLVTSWDHTVWIREVLHAVMIIIAPSIQEYVYTLTEYMYRYHVPTNTYLNSL